MRLVHDSGEEEVLRNLQERDPRFPGDILASDNLKAIAMLPTLKNPGLTSQEQQAVVLICSRQANSFCEAFGELNLALARFLVEILREVIAREEFQREVIRNGIKHSNYRLKELLSKEEFPIHIYDIVNLLLEKRGNPNTGILFLTIRVDVIFDKNLKVSNKNELENSSLERVFNRISSYIDQFSGDLKNEFTVYEIEKMSLVFMFQPLDYQENIQSFRHNLQKHLDELKSIKAPMTISTNIWSLFFSVRQLKNLLDKERNIESLVKFLVSQNQNTIQSLPHIRDGDEHLRNHNYQQALSEYLIAYRQNPDNPYVIRHIIQCYIGLHKYLEAEAKAIEANQKEPNNPTTLRLWGDALNGLGKFDEAHSTYAKALRLFPNSSRILLHIARLLVDKVTHPSHTEDISLDEVNEIANYFDLAIKNVPEEEKAVYYAHKASALQLIGQLEDAKLAYKEALKLNPNNVDYQWHYQRLHIN
jgi:tetratricopeptide (TPR) repeat protein